MKAFWFVAALGVLAACAVPVFAYKIHLGACETHVSVVDTWCDSWEVSVCRDFRQNLTYRMCVAEIRFFSNSRPDHH